MPNSNEWFLISHWDFSDGSGTTLSDVESTNGSITNNGTINGSPTWGSADGWNGQNSLTFNGTSGQKISFGSELKAASPAPDPIEYVNSNWLLKIWFKTTDTSGRSLAFIDLKTDDANQYERFKLYTGTDGKIRFVVYVDFFNSYAADYIESDINIADGELHEVAIHQCYRNKYTQSCDVHLWVDKQYAGSLSSANYLQRTSNNYLEVAHGDVYSGWPGGASRAFTDSWVGSISDIKLYFWNGATGDTPFPECGASLVEDEILEWTPPLSVANAMMFSCNT